MIIRSRLAAFGMVALLLASAHARGQTSPEDLLKSKNLARVGSYYLLDEDTSIPERIRNIRALEDKVQTNKRLRAVIERDIDQTFDTLNTLDDQNTELTAKLNATSKNAYATYNGVVDKVNVVRAQIREGVKYLAKRRDDLSKLADPTEDYVSAVMKASDVMERVATRYAALSADQDVVNAIARINLTAAPKVNLGPSVLFSQELSHMRKRRESVTSGAIKLVFDGGVTTVPVAINDSQPIMMVVDSGAAYVSLSTKFLMRLRLARRA